MESKEGVGLAKAERSGQSEPALGLSDRIAIINALMTQDRIEVRERQEAMWKLTYYVIPAFITVAGVFVNQPHLRNLLLTSECLLLLLYIVVYLVFRIFLKDARACLQIRESFYKKQELLCSIPFTPLRTIDPSNDYGALVDRHVWFPFLVAVLVGVVMLVYMLIF